jgi:hypothetical protein
VLVRIGLLVGDESALEQALAARAMATAGVVVERVRVGAACEQQPWRQDVVIDRVSHRVPHYRSWLAAAAAGGVSVVPDPACVAAADGFAALSVAARLGLEAPRTVLLPQKAYGADAEASGALGHLAFPFDWKAAVDHVGFPARLRSVPRAVDAPAWPGGEVAHEVADWAALHAAFDASGERPNLLEEARPAELWVRCLCVGDRGRAFAWSGAGSPCPPPGSDALVAGALRLSRALGLRINAVDFGVTGGRAWLRRGAAPYCPLGTLGEGAYDAFADGVIALALGR